MFGRQAFLLEVREYSVTSPFLSTVDLGIGILKANIIIVTPKTQDMSSNILSIER